MTFSLTKLTDHFFRHLQWDCGRVLLLQNMILEIFLVAFPLAVIPGGNHDKGSGDQWQPPNGEGEYGLGSGFVHPRHDGRWI
jgi:hypothetical protein